MGKFAFRTLRKLIFMCIGLYVIYQILYMTGVITLLGSLWRLAERSDIISFFQNLDIMGTLKNIMQ